MEKVLLDTKLKEQIIAELDRLSSRQQQELLDFARAMHAREIVGVPAESLLDLAGSIDPEDARQMRKAIEEA